MDRKIARITNGLIVLALIPTRLSSAGQISLVCKHEFKRDHRQVINLIEMYLDDETLEKSILTWRDTSASRTKIQAKSYYLDRFWIIVIDGKFERSIVRVTRELRTMQRWRAVIFEISALMTLFWKFWKKKLKSGFLLILLASL